MASTLETCRAPAVIVGAGRVGVALIGVTVTVVAVVGSDVAAGVGVARGVACPFAVAKRMSTKIVNTNTPPTANVWGRLVRQELFRIACATAQRSRTSRQRRWSQ